jgi:hypothetical protein
VELVFLQTDQPSCALHPSTSLSVSGIIFPHSKGSLSFAPVWASWEQATPCSAGLECLHLLALYEMSSQASQLWVGRHFSCACLKMPFLHLLPFPVFTRRSVWPVIA